MNSMLEGPSDVVCPIDDTFILICSKDLQVHNERLISTLKAIQQAGLTVNHEKWQFIFLFLF